MKRGIVYYRDIPAGELVKDDDGYLFRYDPTYFVDPSMPDVSATLPKTQREYRSMVLFPFFFGLLAEGANGATPAALSFLRMTCPNPADVYGFHLSPIAIGDGPLTVTGMSLGVVDSLVMDEVRGIQVAGLFSFGWPSGLDKTRIFGCQMSGLIVGADCVTGIQAAGVFAGTDDMTGLQLAGLFSIAGNNCIHGVQIAGLFSQSESCHGAQIALWNGSESMYGAQIGLMNFAVPAEDGWVLQIGLVNGIGRDSKSGWLDGTRYLPVVNLGW